MSDLFLDVSLSCVSPESPDICSASYILDISKSYMSFENASLSCVL